jgi:hypothetical protein
MSTRRNICRNTKNAHFSGKKEEEAAAEEEEEEKINK